MNHLFLNLRKPENMAGAAPSRRAEIFVLFS
jgi:hypothetical protein